MADEIFYLADQAVRDDTISADKLKLQIDARKWFASKMMPLVFGEPVLVRNRVARQEEQEFLDQTKNTPPANNGKSDIPTDPKQIARIINWILTKNARRIDGEQ